MNVTQEVLINKAREGLTDYQASLLEHLFSFCFFGCEDNRVVKTWAERIKNGTIREYADSQIRKLIDTHAKMYEYFEQKEQNK